MPSESGDTSLSAAFRVLPPALEVPEPGTTMGCPAPYTRGLESVALDVRRNHLVFSRLNNPVCCCSDAAVAS